MTDDRTIIGRTEAKIITGGEVPDPPAYGELRPACHPDGPVAAVYDSGDPDYVDLVCATCGGASSRARLDATSRARFMREATCPDPRCTRMHRGPFRCTRRGHDPNPAAFAVLARSAIGAPATLHLGCVECCQPFLRFTLAETDDPAPAAS